MKELYTSATYLLNKYGKELSEKVTFQIDKSLINDDYRIEKENEKIILSGNSAVAFNAAVGKFIRLGEKAYNQTFRFEKKVRGTYFANHFYNFYHVAPIEKVYDYIEELSLWGQNFFVLWFDLHHFSSINDPHAQEMLDRMEKFYRKAKELGMNTLLIHLGNEYYYESDQKLRAECSTENGLYQAKPVGFYYTELCPSKSEGEKLLLESFRQIMEYFQKVGIDYLCLSPYDQGGCTCKDCYPWGANGFYRISKLKTKIAKEYFPDIKIICSTWRIGAFCHGEWEPFLNAVKNDGKWIDYIVSDVNAYLPDEIYSLGVPVLCFPEISMAAVPWGGYGAMPIPNDVKNVFAAKWVRCAGGYSYSEGLFEDINKITVLELFRDSTLSVREIIKEYVSYYFEGYFTEELTELILDLEQTGYRNVFDKNGNACDYPSGMQTELPIVKIHHPENIEKIAKCFIDLDKKMPEQIKRTWRYQTLFIRALGDYELVKNGGIPNEKTDAIFGRLSNIYLSEKNTDYVVAPFTRESFLRNRSDGDL